MSDKANMIACRECGVEIPDYLANHLLEVHGISTKDYLAKYPGAMTVSDRLLKRHAASKPNLRRELPPGPEKLTVTIANVEFPVNHQVPASACLPIPDHYRVPQYGDLGDEICHVVISLKMHRSIYVWGMPGCGKDAFFHYFSWVTRTPAMIRQIKPGTDIESWFFCRGFTEKGTYWEEGEVTRALRDGFEVKDDAGKVIKRIPYMVLLTDFDRADPDQAEQIRLITDSIQGRIDGPAGKVYDVLPGTMIVATANTSGGGDERGRMISARPVDASILERFDRGIRFDMLDWRDEEPIVAAKFSLLAQKCPSAITKIGEVTKALRAAIQKDELHCEFSHRGLCSILGHAEDMIRCSTTTTVRSNLMALASRVWLDRLPDKVNREAAKKILDPKLGTLDMGNTAQAGNESLLQQMAAKKGSK